MFSEVIVFLEYQISWFFLAKRQHPSELSNPEFHIIPLNFKFSFVVFNVIFGGFSEKFYVQTARFEKLGTNGKS